MQLTPTTFNVLPPEGWARVAIGGCGRTLGGAPSHRLLGVVTEWAFFTLRGFGARILKYVGLLSISWHGTALRFA